MRIRRKVTHCLNCNALLDEVYNYCPRCGQENNDNNVSVSTLIHDFFSNYFAFDSKLAKTVVPFFTRPGYITNRYFEGKRVSYAHPLRMYLIISLFYFFIWTQIAKEIVQDSQSTPILELQDSPEAEAALQTLDSTAMAEIRENLSPESVRKIDSTLAANDSISFMNAFRRFTTRQEREDVAGTLTQSILDSTITQLPGETTVEVPEINIPDTVEVDSAERDNFVLFRLDYEKLNEIGKDRTLTDSQVLDSLAMGDLTETETDLVLQTIRINRADKEALVSYIVKNLPIMMLFLIPVFAAVLKLLYIRRPFLYFNHIIHGLHLHSFAYLMYGLTLLLTYFLIESEDLGATINVISFIGVTTYCYLSFLRVYKQGWFKTLVKFNLNGFIYIMLIFAFFLVELLISFYLY